MPDLRGAGLAVLIAAGPAAAQTDCTPRSEIVPGPDTYRLVLDLPCASYAGVALGIGPITVMEETSAFGRLDVVVPRWPGVSVLSLAWDGGQETLAVPPAEPGAGRVALLWSAGGAGGDLGLAGEGPAADGGRLGFPGPEAQILDWLAVAEGQQPVLRVPVAEPFCGGSIEALLVTDRAPVPAPLSLALPPCGAEGLALRLSLPR